MENINDEVNAKLERYIFALWSKDGSIPFPDREVIETLNWELDLEENENWFLWEKEMQS